MLREKKNLLFQLGIEVRFLSIAARRLIAIVNDISYTINKIVQVAAIKKLRPFSPPAKLPTERPPLVDEVSGSGLENRR
jgi:hypothetical protein